MNIQEYISGGIVESYVLGLASEEERREFEERCRQYPELLQARIDFELALEKQALAHAETPKPSVKEQFLATIAREKKVDPAPVRKLNGWRIAAAACLALLAGSAYLNFTLTNTNRQLRSETATAKAELAATKKDIQTLIGNPELKMAALKGTEMAPAAYTTVYWDTSTHDVYMLVNNLPKPADSLQYQLWALADGQPIDLGFISDEHFIRQDKLLLKAKNAQKAQAFAITLEKKGRADISKPAGKIFVVGNL